MRVALPLLAWVTLGLLLAGLLPRVADLARLYPAAAALVAVLLAVRKCYRVLTGFQTHSADDWLAAVPADRRWQRIDEVATACAHGVVAALPAVFSTTGMLLASSRPAEIGRYLGWVLLLWLAGMVPTVGTAKFSAWRTRHRDPQARPRMPPARLIHESAQPLPAWRLISAWQWRLIARQRPDRFKRLLAVIAVMLPIGTPLGMALAILLFAWLLATAADALRLCGRTSGDIAMLMLASPCSSWWWFVQSMPLQLLVGAASGALILWLGWEVQHSLVAGLVLGSLWILVWPALALRRVLQRTHATPSAHSIP